MHIVTNLCLIYDIHKRCSNNTRSRQWQRSIVQTVLQQSISFFFHFQQTVRRMFGRHVARRLATYYKRLSGTDSEVVQRKTSKIIVTCTATSLTTSDLRFHITLKSLVYIRNLIKRGKLETEKKKKSFLSFHYYLVILVETSKKSITIE